MSVRAMILMATLIPAWASADDEPARRWQGEGGWSSGETRRLAFSVGGRGDQRFQFTLYEASADRLAGRTPFVGAGSGVLALPDNWMTTGSTTADMPLLQASLQPVRLSATRRHLRLGYERQWAGAWHLDLRYQRDTRVGTRAVGGAFGTTGGNTRAAELPGPIDFATDRLDATLVHHGNRYQLGFAFHTSRFDNHQPVLTWQNPFGQVPAWAPGVGYPDGQGRMALEPDNTYNQVRGFGAYRLSERVRFTADIALGRMRQNVAFLPYTINPALSVPSALPRTQLDGRIDTTTVNLRMTATPLTRLSLNLRYRLEERDNRTPIAAYQPVTGDAEDQTPLADARFNTPYSFREHRLSVDGTYRLATRIRVVAGAEARDVRRDYAETNAHRETIHRVGVRFQPASTLAVSMNHRRARRHAEPWDGTGFVNHPALRKYHLTDRDRTQLHGRADWTPGTRVTAGLSASHARDQYDDAFFGLNSGQTRSVSVDAGYHMPDAWTLGVWATVDRMAAAQTGRAFTNNPAQQLDPDRDWAAHHRDRARSAGFHLTYEGFGRVVLGLEATATKVVSRIQVSTGPALTSAPLPVIRSRSRRLSAHATTAINAHWTVQLGAAHERVVAQDFARDGVGPDTLANVLGLGAVSPHPTRTVWFGQVRARF